MKDQNKTALIKLWVLRILAYFFLLVTAFMCLFSFYCLLVNASKSNAELKTVGKLWFSSHFFENMYNLMFVERNDINVLRALGMSFLVASLSAIVTTYFSALTAYGVYAYRFKGRKFIATFILAIMMIPNQIASVGFVEIVYKYHLVNQLWLLILPGIAAPATYFYMLQYLKSTLPLELVEASRIDGYNEFSTFNRVVLPIMKPAMAVQLIFSFVASWNNYYLPNLIIKDPDKHTIPIVLALLRSKQQSQNDAGQVWMIILISVLPVIIVYLILSKSIIKGVTSGSVKG